MRSSTGNSALVPLGVIIAPHGVRGELRVKLHNPSSKLLAGPREITLRLADQESRRNVTKVHVHREGLLLITLAGCEDRDAADLLRGAQLCIARSELPTLPRGETYLVDLVGLQALRPNGEALGEVEDAFAYPASEVLRVKTPQGILEIPLAPPYVVEVNLEEGRVIVDQLEDLEFEKPVRGAKG